MWVTPTSVLNTGSTIFLELSTFKHQTNNAFRSITNFNNDVPKNGKAAHFNNEPPFFTGWHLSRLNCKIKQKTIGY